MLHIYGKCVYEQKDKTFVVFTVKSDQTPKILLQPM